VTGDVATERLGAIAELGRWAVVQALEELEEHGLLQDGRPSHDLVRETAYARLSPARRRHLHARAAETAPPDEDAHVVAEHWIQARRLDRATEALGRAAATLRARGLIEEALTVARRSSELLEAPSSRILEAELLVALRQYDEADALLGALRTAVDDRVRARALVAATHLELRRGRRADAAATARLAVEATRRLDDDLQLEGLLAAANVAALTGDQGALLGNLEAHLERVGDSVRGDLRAQALSNLAWLHAGLGRFEGALRHYEAAWQVAVAGGDRYWQVWIAANTLYCCLELGCPDAALARAEGALDENDASDASEILRINLAKAYADLGRDAEAVDLLEGLLRDCDDPSNRAVALGYLTALRHRGGDAAAGRTALADAVALLAHTDLDRARVRIAIAVLRHGDDAQRRDVAPIVASLSRAAIPGYVWRELEALL
jgi:tetratricopeptide (TPR) repeat protein